MTARAKPRRQGTLGELSELQCCQNRLPADLTRVRLCGRCNERYREFHNLGSWQCAYHTGEHIMTTNADGYAGTWSCCGFPYGVSSTSPCTPCDHVEVETYVSHEPPVFLKRPEWELLRRAGGLKRPSGLVFDEPTERLYVYRRRNPDDQTTCPVY